MAGLSERPWEDRAGPVPGPWCIEDAQALLPITGGTDERGFLLIHKTRLKPGEGRRQALVTSSPA